MQIQGSTIQHHCHDNHGNITVSDFLQVCKWYYKNKNCIVCRTNWIKKLNTCISPNSSQRGVESRS